MQQKVKNLYTKNN